MCEHVQGENDNAQIDNGRGKKLQIIEFTMKSIHTLQQQVIYDLYILLNYSININFILYINLYLNWSQ